MYKTVNPGGGKWRWFDYLKQFWNPYFNHNPQTKDKGDYFGSGRNKSRYGFAIENLSYQIGLICNKMVIYYYLQV